MTPTKPNTQKIFTTPDLILDTLLTITYIALFTSFGYTPTQSIIYTATLITIFAIARHTRNVTKTTRWRIIAATIPLAWTIGTLTRTYL